jgi:glutamate dehydrogenase (NAD(P)+)
MIHTINPPEILEVSDASAGLMGWLAVDSIVDGHFCGGLRMLPDVSPEELSELARAMTLKHAFLGLPHGGAKAGILYDEDRQKQQKAALLAAFGRKTQDLLRNRIYLPGSDMGTDGADVRGMMEAIGIRVPRRALLGKMSGWYTSLTVVASVKAAAAEERLDLSKATAAIEGFGQVGSAVAEDLRNLGCAVVAISTFDGALYSPEGLDVKRLVEGYRQHGSRMIHFINAGKISRESLLELDVDVLIPCARHHSINLNNASRIKARLISCGANVPATKEAERLLWERGILCVPDFVANAGGVLGGTMEFAGIRPFAIADFVGTHFSRQVAALIGSARREGTYIRDKAEQTAAERWARVKRSYEKPSLRNSIFSAGLHLYRHGWIPTVVAARPAARYFRRRLEGGM